MKLHKSSERGQALVIIALAMIGLIAITGLAIDGGNVYSDRRHAQNSADAAALAAGLARVRENPGGTGLSDNVKQAGLDRAASNGYEDDDMHSVQVISPPISGEYKDDDAYIQVIIISQVRTYFARVLGIDHMTNNVNAVVRVEPFPDYPVLKGNAIISCNQTECPAVTVGGSSSTTLIDGGLFVNSNCTDNTNKDSFEIDGTHAGLTAPSLCAVGGYQEGANLNVDSITSDCRPIDCATQIEEPNFSEACPNSVSVDTNDPTLLHPGKFSSNSKSFPPSGIEKLAPGVYCIDTPRGFRMNSGTLEGGCSPDDEDAGLCDGEAGVVFDVEQGGIIINAPHVHLYAPRSKDEIDFNGLLFFMPTSAKDDVVTINGNADNEFVGTIMAMGSQVTVNGGSATAGFLSTQIIGNKVDVNGSAGNTIKFEGDKSYQPEISPNIEFVE